jgi:hypothetical protein
MRLDEFESKQLKQINTLDKQLNEGLGIGSTILNWLCGSKFTKILNDVTNQEEDFPDNQAAIHDLYMNLDMNSSECIYEFI